MRQTKLKSDGEDKSGIILETETIRIGKEETVAKLMKDLIEAIRQIKQGTAAGGPTLSPLFNDSVFVSIENRLKNFMDVQ